MVTHTMNRWHFGLGNLFIRRNTGAPKDPWNQIHPELSAGHTEVKTIHIGQMVGNFVDEFGREA